MAKVNLKAGTDKEKMLLEYLTKYASEDLAQRINNGTKTLAQCWNYIVSVARKKAVGNCACVEDNTVYGWMMHFFEEDGIKGEDFNKVRAGVAASVKEPPVKVEKAEPKPKKKKDALFENQLSMDDLFGACDGSDED